MNDAFGRVLKIGEKVAKGSADNGSCYLDLCEVIDFTPKRVKVIDVSTKRIIYVSSNNLVKLTEEGL